MATLLEIYRDPNYVNANAATKQAIFERYAPNDPDYANANPATQAAIRQRFGLTPVAEAVQAERPAPTQYGGFTGSFGTALKERLSTALPAASLFFDAGSRKTATEELLKAKEEAEAAYKQTEFGEIGEAFKKGEFGTALGKTVDKFKEVAGSSLGSMAPAMATSAAVGAGAVGLGVAAAPAALIGTTAYGVLALGSYLADNIARQKEEQKKVGKEGEDINRLTASAAAAGQTALDIFGFKFFKPLGQLVGINGKEAAERAAMEIVVSAVQPGAYRRAIATGTAKGIAFEVPQEVTQTVLERWQAGLPLNPFDDPEAAKEYAEAAGGALLLGGPMGAYSRASQTYTARKSDEGQALIRGIQEGSVLDRLGQEEEDVGQVVTRPGRRGAEVPSQPPAGEAPAGVGGTEPTGVVLAGQDVGAPAVGKGAQPPSVTSEPLDIADFKEYYQGIRGELTRLMGLTAPTEGQIDMMQRLSSELNSLVDANAENLTQSSSDPDLVKNLKNPAYNGLKDLERVERRLGTPRAMPMQGDMFGTPESAFRRARMAMQLADNDPVKAAQLLEEQRQRLLADQAAGRFDENWAISTHRNMPAGEAVRNAQTLAEQHVQRTMGTIDAALDVISRQQEQKGAPRAAPMQGDLFAQEGEDDRINRLAQEIEAKRQARLAEQERQKQEAPPTAMGEAMQAAGIEPTEPAEKPAFPERVGVTPPEEGVKAPDVSTEHVAKTQEGNLLAGFFSLIQPAGSTAEEQSKHQSSKNTAASEFLEYDVVQPGETTSPGVRQALNYLASLVGGATRLQELMGRLEGKTAESQAEIFRAYGLPDLTSRRGMDAFSGRVQEYFKQLRAPEEGGIPISTREGRMPATGEFKGKAPYAEEVSVISKVVQVPSGPKDGRPRRPTTATREKKYNLNVQGLRGAVRAIRQLIGAKGKLSPQQIAARNYLDNRNRETFGQALNDLAFDLAYFELDPRNHGANSTFYGEGGRYALAFKQWVEQNLDPETVGILNQMVDDYKANYQAEQLMDAEVSAYQRRLEEYNEKRFAKAEKDTGVKITRKRRPVSEVVEETEVSEREKVPSGRDLTRNLPRLQMLAEVHPAIMRVLERGDTNGALRLIADAPGNPYFATLAKRLLEANLTAKTTFVEADAMSPLSGLEETQQLFDLETSVVIEAIRTIVPADEQAAYIAALRSGNMRDVLAAIQRLEPIFAKANPAQNEIFNNYAELFESQFAWVGKYDPNTDQITLRKGIGQLTNHTFLHEVLHAATLEKIDNPDQLTGLQRQAYDELVKLYDYAKGILSQDAVQGMSLYGLKDLHEFVSEANTNPEFQAKLRALTYTSTQPTIWNAFTRAIAKLFNIKPGRESNVMVEAMRATDTLMAQQAEPSTEVAAEPGSTEAFREEQGYYKGLRTESREEQRRGVFERQAQDKTKQPRAMPAARQRRRPIPGGMPNQKTDVNRLLTSQNWNDVKRELPRLLRSMSATARPYLLGGLTLRQLNDLVAGRIPQISNFIRVTEEFLSRKNGILKEAGDISKRWERLQGRDPEMSTRIGRVMHMATIAEVDPDRATLKQRNAQADLMNEWRALSPEAKQIYRDVRNFYENRYREYKRLMMRRIVQMRQLGVSEQTILEIRNEFEKGALKGPYFPLMRHGRFFYQIGRGNTREYYMFESQGQMEAHIEERLRKNPELRDTVFSGNQYAEQMDLHARESNFLKATFEAIDDAKMTGLSGAAADQRKQELKDSMYQTFLANQPERSFRRQFMHRNNIEGFSQDALRNFATSSFHMAYQIARFEHAPELFSQLDAARTQLKNRVKETGYDPELSRENNLLSDYVAEVDRRLEAMLNPNDVGTIPSLLSNIGFIYYLTSVASAAVNILGGAIIGVPTLVGQYVRLHPNASYSKATMEVLKQLKTTAGQIMSTGVEVDTGAPLPSGQRGAKQRAKDVATKLKEFEMSLPSLDRSTDMSAVDRAAYNRFVAEGLIDITQTYDISGLAATPSEQYGGAAHRAMSVLTYLFHNAERFNREMMAMSAFRIAMEKRAGMADRQRAFSESVAEAKDATNRAMFDYSSTNKPRYFQHPVARVVLQFKQFPQQMTFFLTKNLIDSIKDQPREVQREARARFVGIMGMTAIFAGTTGLWGYSVVASIINAVINGLSDSDDEPFDFDLAYMEWATETFGKNVGTLLTRGIGNAVGVDIASRAKLDDMWFRDSRENQDEEEAIRTFLVDLLGPTIGLLPTAAVAVRQWNQGHGDRALETVMPGFAKQPLIAYRYSQEGVRTLKGEVMVEDVGPFSLFMQSLGLRPADVAEIQAYNIKVKGQEQKILKKRQDLLNLYGLAFMSGDFASADEAMTKIDKFNERNPSVAIPIDSILTSIEQRLEKSTVTDHGLYVDERLRGTLDRYKYAKQ